MCLCCKQYSSLELCLPQLAQSNVHLRVCRVKGVNHSFCIQGVHRVNPSLLFERLDTADVYIIFFPYSYIYWTGPMQGVTGPTKLMCWVGGGCRGGVGGRVVYGCMLT